MDRNRWQEVRELAIETGKSPSDVIEDYVRLCISIKNNGTALN